MARVVWFVPSIGVLIALSTSCGGHRAAAPAPAQPGADGPAVAVASDPEARARVADLWRKRGNATAEDLCLGPGDLVEITVFHWPEMQGLRTRVSSTGTINLPLLGTIPAAGRTEAELRDDIAKRLGARYLRDPQVSVFVAENASQQVSVTGAVARPGLLGISRDNRTLSDLISEAGGLNEHAGGTILFYPSSATGGCGARGGRPRHADARADIEPIEVDVNEAWNPPQQNPLNLPVVGGDAVVVNRGRFLVDGWVQNPGAYEIAPGMTAFGGVTAAGGASYPADLSRVVVWRTKRGMKQRIDVDMAAITAGRQRDVTLQAGDVIEVPASTLKLVPYSGFWIVTNVVRVGAGLTLGF